MGASKEVVLSPYGSRSHTVLYEIGVNPYFLVIQKSRELLPTN